MTNRIGRYEIQAELGHGGQGKVFRAFDPTVNRLVAIKTLTTGREPELLTRFRNEAAAAGNLHHQNIVTIYDFGEHDGFPFLVMELLDGETLEQIITLSRPQTLLEKLEIIMQVAAGLYHAHCNTIIHRDVKPANVIVLRDGTVKILDFGIARLTRGTAPRLTIDGSLLGTLQYMAPEQFDGTPSDIQTDIFAYGVTCYRLLTGVHPFEASEVAKLMNNIINKEPARLHLLNLECPEVLEEIISRTLAKDREFRYQNLQDVQFDIEPIIAELRKESVNDLLIRVQGLLETEALDEAQKVIQKVLAIDPGHRTAQQLRHQLQKLIKEKKIRPRIAQLLDESRDLLQAREFEQAIQKLEAALQLDKANADIRSLIDQAHAAWDQAQRAGGLTDEAQRALYRGDLTVAHQKIVEAESADPHHPAVQPLLATVRNEMQARERQRHLHDCIEQAKRLLLIHNFDEAVEKLNELVVEFPKSPELEQLLERARNEQQAQLHRLRLQEALAAAKRLLRDRSFREAVDHISRLRGEFPESAELCDLHSYAEEELNAEQKAAAITHTIHEVRDLMNSKQFNLALERVRIAITEYPDNPSLRDLAETVSSAKAERERRLALGDTLKQANLLSDAGKFAEALDCITQFVSAYGDSPALGQLRREAKSGLERQRRVAAVQELILKARGLLADGRPATAHDVLQRGTIQFPNDPEVAHLLSVAVGKLREQEAEQISRVATEAQSLTVAKRFESAFALLDQSLKQYPASEILLRAREATVAGQLAAEQVTKDSLLVEKRQQTASTASGDGIALDITGHSSKPDRQVESALTRTGNNEEPSGAKESREASAKAPETLDLSPTRILRQTENPISQPTGEWVSAQARIAEEELETRKIPTPSAPLLREKPSRSQLVWLLLISLIASAVVIIAVLSYSWLRKPPEIAGEPKGPDAITGTSGADITKGSVVITREDGVDITLDNTPIVEGSDDPLPLDRGLHVVVYQFKGEILRRYSMEIRADKVSRITVGPLLTHLKIEAVAPPVGMTVSIDGGEELPVPRTVDLKPGLHSLHFQAPKYMPYDLKNEFAAGKLTLPIPMNPLPSGAASPRRVDYDRMTVIHDERPSVCPATVPAPDCFASVEVLVGIQGTVESLRGFMGPDALRSMAMEKAKKWTFKATIVAGQSVPAITTIPITFLPINQ